MEFVQSGKILALNILIKDAVSKGAVVKEVDFRRNEKEGVAIYAKTPLAAGEVVFSIPFELCLSMNLVENSAIKEILDERPDLLNHPDEVLAIALMHSINHKECAWSNHAQSMPDTFNSTLFWTDAELQELRECTVFHLTNLMKRQIKSDWETLHGPLAMRYPHLLGAASLNSYTWALSVIYSRAVGIVRNGQYIRCVPPIIDMANHNPRAAHTVEETLAYDDVNDRILLLNTSSKKPGDEIYALYGVYPNSKLLYTYGFVIPGNPHRAIDLWTRVTQSTYDYITKQEILENHELTQEQLYDFTGTLREKWISPSLLATIRVIHANEHEMENIENAFHGGMISTRNEMVSYVSLRNLLLARLKPEKVETDRLKLRELMASQHDADEHPRLLMALITRVEERELIQSCLEMVDSWMATLENKGEDYTPPDYVTNNISGSVEDNDKGEVGLNLDANHVE